LATNRSRERQKKRLKLSRGIRPYYPRPNHKAHKKTEGMTLPHRTGCWIKYQLNLRNLTYDTVAEKAGVHVSMITHFLRCRKNSEKVKAAIAEVLGFPSFDAVIAASRGKEAV